MNWQRGSRTYIFTATDQSAKFYDINHDNRQVHIDKLELSDLTNEVNNFFQSTPDVMAQARLTCPTSITYLDTDNIIFERCKQGFIPGFRSDRTEIVNGYECKVFTANNVQLITKTRTEHLSEEDKKNYYKQAQANTIPFQSLLNTVEIIDKNYTDEEKLSNIEQINNFNLSKISLEQYFDPNYPIKGNYFSFYFIIKFSNLKNRLLLYFIKSKIKIKIKIKFQFKLNKNTTYYYSTITILLINLLIPKCLPQF